MSTLLGQALHPAHLISELKTRSRDSVLVELARQAQEAGVALEADLLSAALRMRERLGPTCVGRGVAIPNARSLTVARPVVMVGRSRRGVDWGAADGEAVRLVVLVLSPATMPAARHLAEVARALAATRTARARQRLLESVSAEAVAGLLREVTG